MLTAPAKLSGCKSWSTTPEPGGSCNSGSITHQRWQRAHDVLEQSASIEKAIDRLRDLREVYPKLHEITVLRGQANQADKSLQQLTALRRTAKAATCRKGKRLAPIARKAAIAGKPDSPERVEIPRSGQALRRTGMQVNTLKQTERREQRISSGYCATGGTACRPRRTAQAGRKAYESFEELTRRAAPNWIAFGQDAMSWFAFEQAHAIETQLKSVRATGEERKSETEHSNLS